MKTSRNQGFTLIELVIVIALAGVIIVIIGPPIASGISGFLRSNTDWTDGRFITSPNLVDVSPATGTFLFALKEGTGVDTNGRPMNYRAGTGIAGNKVTVSLWRPNPINGTLVSLNSTALAPGTTSASVDSDINGWVKIVVEVDDYKSFKLEAIDTVTGGKEAVVFIGN